jgi:hypothetical protein
MSTSVLSSTEMLSFSKQNTEEKIYLSDSTAADRVRPWKLIIRIVTISEQYILPFSSLWYDDLFGIMLTLNDKSFLFSRLN